MRGIAIGLAAALSSFAANAQALLTLSLSDITYQATDLDLSDGVEPSWDTQDGPFFLGSNTAVSTPAGSEAPAEQTSGASLFFTLAANSELIITGTWRSVGISLDPNVNFFTTALVSFEPERFPGPTLQASWTQNSSAPFDRTGPFRITLTNTEDSNAAWFLTTSATARIAPVYEPTSAAMMLLGLGVLAARRRASPVRC